MKFSVEQVTTNNRSKLSGPKELIMAAMAVIDSGNFKDVDRIYRVNFDTKTMHQELEGRTRNKELTGYDTLVLVDEYKNVNVLCMFVHMGANFCPVAIRFSDESPDETIITPIYKRHKFADKLSPSDIHSVFTRVESDLQ